MDLTTLLLCLTQCFTLTLGLTQVPSALPDGTFQAANCAACDQEDGTNGSLKLDNDVPYMLIGFKWMPICGHFFWDNNIGADIVCQNLGYSQGGVVEKQRGSYSEDAYYVGRCDSRSTTDLVNGCTKETLAPHLSCTKGRPVSIKVKCKEKYPQDVNCDACDQEDGTNGKKCNVWHPTHSDSCHYCSGNEGCKPGCLENSQCSTGLECRDHICVFPPIATTRSPPMGDSCSADRADSCDVCSGCQPTVTWSCSIPPECCPEKPCPPCYDCINGKCEHMKCGVCTSCNATTGSCEPMECGACGTCKDDSCEDCSDLCPEACSDCKHGECSDPKECCDEKACPFCQDCVHGTCVDRDCGDFNSCNSTTNKCETTDCGPCKDFVHGACVERDCGICSECSADLNKCQPKKCDDCYECDTTNGECKIRECGTCSSCKENECVPMDCKECGVCKNNTCIDCSDICPEACSKCKDLKCQAPTECCDEKPCKPCQDCVEGKCVDIDCGECGKCDPKTNECKGVKDLCNPDCNVPDCQRCVGIPGKIGFQCEEVCSNHDRDCCCVDDDCTNYCEEGNMVPKCDCEQNKCQCIPIGATVINKIFVCTDKCEGCDENGENNKLVLTLLGEKNKEGRPSCSTAKLPIDRDKCAEFGKESDKNICGGCYQYPLQGEIEDDSTVEWKGAGTWSGSFCVTWYPSYHYDVRCKVEDGQITDCEEICDCKMQEKTKCYHKTSVKSGKISGSLEWFK